MDEEQILERLDKVADRLEATIRDSEARNARAIRDSEARQSAYTGDVEKRAREADRAIELRNRECFDRLERLMTGHVEESKAYREGQTRKQAALGATLSHLNVEIDKLKSWRKEFGPDFEVLVRQKDQLVAISRARARWRRWRRNCARRRARYGKWIAGGIALATGLLTLFGALKDHWPYWLR